MMSGVSCNETSMQSLLSYVGGFTVGNASFYDQCGVPVSSLLTAADQNGDSSEMHLLSFSEVHPHQVFSNGCNKLSLSPGPMNAVPTVHMEKGVALPCASTEMMKGIPQIQTGEDREGSEILTDSGLKQLYSYLNLSLEESANITQKVDLNISETAENSPRVLDYDQNGMSSASSEDPSNGGHATICQSRFAVTVAALAKPSKFHALHGAVSRYASTSKSAMNHRIRRARISKAVKELEELVPKSGKHGRESVLDDAIDCVKLLKLQVQLLSQSRLGGEPASDPYIHVEGSGHYLLHDRMKGEPLEEILGQLMETNIAAASHLLERKGLYVIPMALAQDILQTELRTTNELSF